MSNRYRIEYCPRASWEPGLDPADQRWTRTPDVFIGTETELTLHISELDADYGFECNFRGVALDEPELDAHHYCGTCGGDFRESIVHQLACSCPRTVSVDRWGGMAWTRETVELVPGKEAS